ncbi:hypothetical protein M408DRAFT_21390 [Serendipita vermifera MAFF 305830]|uniref:FAD-binding domain-containing protein n=1 Tax=Serendipita vermifera MAFF 305830 TaxID=933852 RepID=A0A0C3BGP0_SERVB|nr:hypothetical protein M408DRAFT_21390 [Serendipita vermifera MAFF 305830]
MPTTPLQVLIVGNGVVGSILAMALQKTTPHKIIVVDAGPKDSVPIGAGVGMTPNGANALSFIDADYILTERGCMYHGIQMGRGDTDRLLLKEATAETYSKNWGHGTYGISRQVLVGSLRELAEKRGIEMRFNMRLTTVEEKDKVVTARFKDGTVLTADLLFGCDGIHSVVRSYVVGEVAKPRYAGASTVVGISKLSAEDEAAANLNRNLNFWMGKGVLFGTYPSDSEGSWSWQVTWDEDPKGGESDWAKDTSLAVLIKLASEKTASWKSRIPSIVIPKAYRAYPVGLYDRDPMNVWHRGRVVLCGDSAHPTTPFGGQGSQMAAESAVLLARLLGEHEEPSEEVFQKYAQLRGSRTNAVTINARNGLNSIIGIANWRFGFLLELVRDGFLYMFGPSFFRNGMRGLFAYNVATAPLN